jgi:hypothetical protein
VASGSGAQLANCGNQGESSAGVKPWRLEERQRTASANCGNQGESSAGVEPWRWEERQRTASARGLGMVFHCLLIKSVFHYMS